MEISTTGTGFLPRKLNDFKRGPESQLFKGFVVKGTYDICLPTSNTQLSGWHTKGPSETIKYQSYYGSNLTTPLT